MGKRTVTFKDRYGKDISFSVRTRPKDEFKDLERTIDKLDSGNTDWNYIIDIVDEIIGEGCGNLGLSRFNDYLVGKYREKGELAGTND